MMKPKILLSILLIATGIGMNWANAQTMYVKLNDGTVETVALSTLKKLTFGSGNLLLNYTAGTTTPYSLGTVSKLQFNAPTGIESTNTGNGVTMYVDQAESMIHFNNLATTSSVKIYGVNGAIAMAALVDPDSPTLSVATLTKGFYLLKINNQVFKFLKK